MNDAAAHDRQFELAGSKINVGRFTYGITSIRIHTYEQNAALNIGSFCCLATEINILLGGEHHTRTFSTYPFGHPRFLNELGGESIKPFSGTRGDVNIGHDVWIGFGATILSGVTIGSGAVIAARATVVNDVAPYAVVGGTPARAIRSRFHPDVVKLLLELQWWSLPASVIKEISHLLYSVEPTEAIVTDLVRRYRGTPRSQALGAA
jgi:acetyltransferase-like isoleucine patch superfamily enzyme